MRIVGSWHVCDDAVARPVVEGRVINSTGEPVFELFLVDSCSDCTVLSADVLTRAALATNPAPVGLSLKGIGGSGNYVVVSAVFELRDVAGATVRVRGELAAFTDAVSTDLSILGRDVLDRFDVILSRRRNEVLLLAGDDRYHVGGAKPVRD